jgi:hypothetical protein
MANGVAASMVVKIPILILKSYDFTIMFALSDCEYTYNPIFVELGGIPINFTILFGLND